MSYDSGRSDIAAARDEHVRNSVRVSMPVKVLAFDSAAMTVDVQPLVKGAIDGEYHSQPPVMAVPIACLCAGEMVIRPWYKRGDTGLLIIGDSDMDMALASGDEAEPNTKRSHAPEDGVFLGGLYTAANLPSGLPDNALVLAAGGTYLAVSSGGIKIQGNLTVTGSITSGGETTAQGVALSSHTHGGVETGGGSTSGPR